MSITKDFRFKVGVAWEGGPLTSVSSPDKPELSVAVPPEFRGGLPATWSPEDLLVASVASCYTVTLAAVAERREVPIHDIQVSGTGHVTMRDDGHLGFVAIELTVMLETLPDLLEAAERAARAAERGCMIAMALDVPVHIEIVARPVGRALVVTV